MNTSIGALTYFISGVFAGTMLALVVVDIVAAAIMPGIDRWNKRFFIVLFTILVLTVSIFFTDFLVFRNPDMALAERIITYFEFLLYSLLMPIYTVFLLHVCKENRRNSVLFGTVLSLWIAYFLLLSIAQFTTFIHYVTPDNQYYRGPWFSLLMIPLISIMVLNLVGVLRRRKKLSGKYFAASLIYLLPIMVALIIHMFISAALLLDIALSLSAISMFVIILSDQIEQYMKQQQEIAHQQARVMVLQMRPHFIYNSMMSIYYLCELDSKKARQVIMDFTTYLRKNFTAIASDHTIPFSEELEHTRAYLAVEQAQFEELLFVDYDTPHLLFRIPPLTLQPIVENAVKHGMDPETGPLHILIRTRETDSGNEIIVEDNGTGVSPSGDSSTHLALANIEQRLRLMCKGKMMILQRDEGGTIVKILIP